MKGSGFAASLPEQPTAGREQAILDALCSAATRLPIQWAAVQLSDGVHQAFVYVATDALSVGETGDAIRVDMTARGAQRDFEASKGLDGAPLPLEPER